MGDSAYPLSTFCITPLRPAQGHQKRFNELHSIHRIVVEHAFGRLKSRFCALRRLSVRDVETAVKLTECAIVLHNFLELKGKKVNCKTMLKMMKYKLLIMRLTQRGPKKYWVNKNEIECLVISYNKCIHQSLFLLSFISAGINDTNSVKYI